MRFIVYTLIGLSLLLGCTQESENHQVHDSKQKEQEKEVYYTCPMHPQVKEDRPGKCPICHMNLSRVEKTKSDHSEHEQENSSKAEKQWVCESYPDVTSPKPGPCPIDGSEMVLKEEEGEKAGEVIARVKLEAARRKHFKPDYFPVTTMKMTKEIHLLGQVLQSEERESNITARIDGRVEKVYVRSTGVFVKQGDPVVDIYSPKLITAGEEFLLAQRNYQKNKNEQYKNLLEQSRKRLELWGVRPFQWEEWARQNEIPRLITVYSTENGIVRERYALDGKYFKEGDSLFDLVDLSRVWVELDVYEADSALVNLGQTLELHFSARPGKNWYGEIDFVSPVIDPKTRTLKVRTTLENTEGLLRPGMVSDAKLKIEKKGRPLVVPRSAVIDTGHRQVVWKKRSENEFQAIKISTGFMSDGYVEVLSGLNENDEVVIEGQFLLDAQAQLFGGYKTMNETKSHQH